MTNAEAIKVNRMRRAGGTSRAHSLGGCGGFTLIEVLAVLLIMAVVMTVILTRTPPVDRDAFAEAAILRSHLRFAQSLAMSHTTERWSVSFTPRSYTLFENGLPSAVRLPNEGSSTHNLPDGVAVTAGIGEVRFDEWGSPGPDTLTISVNTETVTVTGLTGFIP